MKTPKTNPLASANFSATVLENLKPGAPARAAINRALNASLKGQLSAMFKSGKMPALAQLVAKFPSVDFAAKQGLSIRDFVRKQLAPLRPKHAKLAETAKREVSKLSAATTVGSTLQLNLPLGSHPLFQAEIKRLQMASLLSTAPSLSSPQLQNDFLDALAANKGTMAAFWQQLGQQEEFKTLVPALQLTLQLGTLTANNIPLVKALQSLGQKRAFVSLQDFVQVDEADWITLLTTPVDSQAIAIPAGTAGSTPAEQAANYAGELVDSLSSRFPMQAFVQKTASPPAIDVSLVQAVLQANPGLDPSRPLPANLSLAGIGTSDQATALASMAAFRTEIKMFPGFDHRAALGPAAGTTPGPASGGLVNPVRQAVASFLKNAPGFDFQATNIDAYLASNPSALAQIPASEQADAVAQLKSMQRIYRVTSDYPTFSLLMTEGFASANAISSVPSQAFVQRFAGPLGGADSAAALQSKARSISSQAAMLFMRVKESLSPVKPRILGIDGESMVTLLQQNTPAPDASAAPRLFQLNAPNSANWQTLFGSADYCECSDCMAVDGPTAYFVDLLQFLGNSTRNLAVSPNTVGFTPLDVLIGYNNNPINNGSAGNPPQPPGRRPDLAYLKLDCVNATTLLPYIDLVNEIMENFVVYNNGSSAATMQATSNNTPSDATADELSVNPEYTLPAAYVTLAQAPYPLTLPYDRSLDIARVYLNNLKTSREEIMRRFNPQGASADLAIAAEAIGLSDLERMIVEGNPVPAPGNTTASVTLAQFYGFSAGTGRQDLVSQTGTGLGLVNNFLAATGLAYADFLTLIETEFINPTQAITLQTQANANPCDLSATVLVNLTMETLGKAHRFIRLWRKLGWAMADLDLALRVFGTGDITDIVIEDLAGVNWISSTLSLTVAQVLSFWSNLDTNGRDSPYVTLFQNKAVTNPVDPAFQLAYRAESPSLSPAEQNTLPAPTTFIAPIQRQPALLCFVGTMSDDQQQELITWVSGLVTSDPAVAAPAGVAVQKLYQQRWLVDVEVAQPQEPLSNHVNTILAALRIGAQDLQAIRTSAGLIDTPNLKVGLTLANLSTLARYALLAQSLGLGVPDLVSLLVLTGMIPFNTATRLPKTRPMIQFVKAVKKVLGSAFSVAQLNYLYRGVDPTGAVAPLDSDVQLVLSGLGTGLSQIANANVPMPDPQGNFLRKQLAVVLGSASATAAMNLISGTASYSWPLDSLPALTLPGLSGPLSFKAATKTLEYTGGSLSSVQQATLLSLSSDPSFQAAINALATPASSAPLQNLPVLSLPLSPFPAVAPSGVLSYNAATSQLAFAGGTMGLVELAILLGFSQDADYQAAVAALYSTPATSASTPLATFPALTLPYPISGTISYDPVAMRLGFSTPSGTMTALQEACLLGLSSDSVYQDAVKALFANAPANATPTLTELPVLSLPLAPIQLSAPTGVLTYAPDTTTGQLNWAGGPMTPAEEIALLAFAPNDSGYQSAVARLVHSGQPSSTAAWSPANGLLSLTFPAPLSGTLSYASATSASTSPQLSFSAQGSAALTLVQQLLLQGFSSDPSYQAALLAIFQGATTAPLAQLPVLTIPTAMFVGGTNTAALEYEMNQRPQPPRLTVAGGPANALQQALALSFSTDVNYQEALGRLFASTTVVNPTPLIQLPALSFPAPLSGQLSYDLIGKQIKFTGGPITALQQAVLMAFSAEPAYQAAVTAMTQAGTSVASAPLAALPPSLTMPLALFYSPGPSGALTYDPVAQQLTMAGAMTDAERALLLGWSADALYQTAIEYLWQQPRDLINPVAVQPLPALPAISFPRPPSDTISYDTTTLGFANGPMTPSQKILLLSLCSDPSYTSAITALFNAGITTAVAPLTLPLALKFPPAAANQSQPAGTVAYDAVAGQLRYAGSMDSADQQLLLGLCTDPVYQAAVNALAQSANLSLLFSDPAPVIDTLINHPAPVAADRYEYVLKQLMTYLCNSQSRTLVKKTLSNDLALDSATLQLLIEGTQDPVRDAILKSQENPAEPAITDFLELVGPAPGTLATAQASYVLLFKAAIVINTFKIAETELAYLSSHPMDFAGDDPGGSGNQAPFNLNALPLDSTAPAFFNQWQRLCDLFSLRNSLPKGNESLFDVFYAASCSPAPSQLGPNVVNTVLAATGWSAADFAALSGYQLDPRTTVSFNLTDADFTTERGLSGTGLVHLAHCLALRASIGVSCGQLFQWAGQAPDSTQALDIQNTVKAQFDDATWETVGKSLNDQIRSNSRDALVAYILAQAQAGGMEVDGEPVTTADQLYEYFLIDVQMSPCMQTSRIVQASAAVQLFVQRCLMNLENGNSQQSWLNVAPAQIDRVEWESWRKSYRVWQANREVFLTPENWIDPTLRDDRTPFFQDLQSELHQGAVTADSAETAYANYLQKLDEVAQLEIVGLLPEPDPTTKTNTLHVFGRTKNTPHIYFYRTSDQTFNTATYMWVNSWNPWQRVDADIQTDQLIPALWNGRLYLFWPVYTEISDSTQSTNINNNSSTPPTKQLQVQIAWIEYKQGAWSKKQLTSVEASLVPYFALAPNQDPEATPVWNQDYTNVLDTTRFTFEAKPDLFGNLILTMYYQTWLQNTQAHFILYYYQLGYFTFSATNNITSYADPTPSQSGQPLLNYSDDLLFTGYNQQFVGFTEEPEGNSTGGQKITTLSLYTDSSGQTPFGIFNTSQALPLLYSTIQPPGGYSGYSSYSLLFPQPLDLSGCFIMGNPWVFFYQDALRTYLVSELLIPSNFRDGEWADFQKKVLFETHYHPHLRDFVQALNVGGVDGLLQLQKQELADVLGVFYYRLSQADVATDVTNGYHDDGIVAYGLVSPPTDGGSPPGLSDFYVYNLGQPGTTPLYGLSNPKSGGMLYTISNTECQNAQNWYGYGPPSIAGYVFAPGSPGALASNTIPLYRTSSTDFAQIYPPDQTNVTLPYPKADVDFSPGGAYSLYNWELFFHIPLHIATQLSANRQFEDAQKWFHYIFNPTNNAGGPAPGCYWNFMPFNEATEPESLSDLLQDPVELASQVTAYENDPFDPDAIARLRPVAYQKTVVMKYLDNLIAWGDSLFAQNTRESINEATQLYVLAQQILGPKPVLIPPQGVSADTTYNTLGILDDFSNKLVPMENAFPFSSGTGVGTGSNVNNSAVGSSFYFCIPANDTLLGYWDTVTDRLYKIRNCMNLQGKVEQLALFAPPINPAILVAAAAAGVDLSSALADLSASVPYYRFTYILPKALELCAEVRSLGGALLGALEKEDSEALAALRANQEVAVLTAVLQVKQNQINEANANLQGLVASQAVTTARQTYYQGLINAGLSDFEKGQVLALNVAQVFKTLGQATEILGAYLGMIPNVEIGASGISSPVATVTMGGSQLASAASGVARSFDMFADFSSFAATMASLAGQWDRRSQEWTFLAQTAGLELAQIQQQYNAANFRLTIAQEDFDNQNLQISNANDVVNFLQTKFTSTDLYSWMVGEVSNVYLQCFQLAYTLAKQAEQCFQFELGISSSNYIQFGYWDSMKQGLLAGEKLYLDLKRLEMAYLSQNQREYELSKTVSLLLLDPLAFIMLKETGQCMVSLPEAYFDMDYPGHYMRRIKSASLTIPCVAGPYTSVNCTLTLTQSKIRASAAGATPYVEQPVGSDPRFFYSYSATQSVATSTAQNDSGMFEVNFRDERYLPFEGAGVISQWLLSMPPDCNAFDVETITDVLFNLKFTARDGGAPLRDAARAAAVLPLGFSQGGLGGPPAGFPAKQPNLVRYFSLRHEFPTEWYQFFNPTIASATQPMTMPLSLTLDRFPFRFRGRKLAISQCELFLRLRDEYPPSLNSSSTPLSDFGSSALGVALAPPSTSSTSQTPTPWKSNAAVLGGIPYASIAYAGAPLAVPALNSANAASPAPPSAWTLTVSGISSLSPNLIVTINGTDTSGPTPVAVTAALLNPAAIADIFLVCHYSAS